MALYEDKEVKIVSKAEELWSRLKTASEARLKQNQEGVIIETAFIEMCEQKIKKENL